MSAILTPAGLLLIMLAGYLFKRFGLFGQKDYRVLQTAEFNIVLPGAIVYSFATNPHDVSLLWVSLFAFLFAALPIVFIFLSTRKRNVTDRAFLMLNGAGFNLGCFSFPVVQSFWGAGAVVPAAMFDIGNCIMVAAGPRSSSRMRRISTSLPSLWVATTICMMGSLLLFLLPPAGAVRRMPD